MSWVSKLLGRDDPEGGDQIVIVPMPPLIVLLRHHEAAKGSPLTKEEVLEIRDSAICMNMSRSRAERLAESRGFPDIDLTQAWEEWVRVRAQYTS